MTTWKDILFLVIGFALSIVAGLIGAYIQRIILLSGQKRPLNQLLNLGKDDLLFIFPHREEIREAILPRTSTEDFIAMNNVISALINIGWSRKIGVRDTHHVTKDDKKKNLIIICSPKSNEFSLEFQNKLRESVSPFFFFEKTNGNQDHWCITDGDSISRSKSYKQEKFYLDTGCSRRELASKAFEDFAVITKATNPWNSKNKVIAIQGIRGIGTWGAAECLKKEWNQIYSRLQTQKKDTDFSALIKIYYENCDITKIDVRRVITFKIQKYRLP